MADSNNEGNGDDQPVPWRKHPAKAILKKALKDGDIPIDGKQMGPKDVFAKYKDHPAFAGITQDATFNRRLRDLRKKAANKSEDDGIDWGNHPGKEVLLELFREGKIPLGYSDFQFSQSLLYIG